MISKILTGAAVLSFLTLPALAQEHHYQGGAKDQHHIGDLPGAAKKKTPKTTTGQSQKGQHHYEGGPKEQHHIGEKPKT